MTGLEAHDATQHGTTRQDYKITRITLITLNKHTLQAKFLQFVTGTSQVPLGGFSKLAGHLGEVKKFELKWVQYNATTFRYPRGHTCFNRLDVPAYPSMEEMKLCVEAVLNIDVENLRFGLE